MRASLADELETFLILKTFRMINGYGGAAWRLGGYLGLKCKDQGCRQMQISGASLHDARTLLAPVLLLNT